MPPIGHSMCAGTSSSMSAIVLQARSMAHGLRPRKAPTWTVSAPTHHNARRIRHVPALSGPHRFMPGALRPSLVGLAAHHVAQMKPTGRRRKSQGVMLWQWRLPAMPQHELLPTSGRRACHALQSRRAHLNFSCSAMLPFCAKAQHSLIRAPLCARPRPVLRTFDRAIIFICLNRDAGCDTYPLPHETSRSPGTAGCVQICFTCSRCGRSHPLTLPRCTCRAGS